MCEKVKSYFSTELEIYFKSKDCASFSLSYKLLDSCWVYKFTSAIDPISDNSKLTQIKEQKEVIGGGLSLKTINYYSCSVTCKFPKPQLIGDQGIHLIIVALVLNGQTG